ncbi:MAG: hypothetical protein U0003_00335 [Vampirovibrionales bacterium]
MAGGLYDLGEKELVRRSAKDKTVPWYVEGPHLFRLMVKRLSGEYRLDEADLKHIQEKLGLKIGKSCLQKP